ncbi:MAG: hypothetical protein ACI90M_004337, partial [Candidatus Azotimanducaceae bacterium]
RCIDVLLRALAELTRDDIHPHPGSSRRQLRKVTANKLNIGAHAIPIRPGIPKPNRTALLNQSPQLWIKHDEGMQAAGAVTNKPRLGSPGLTNLSQMHCGASDEPQVCEVDQFVFGAGAQAFDLIGHGQDEAMLPNAVIRL